MARGVPWPDQRLIAIDADPELLGQRHCSRWFRGLVTIPGGEYIYSASTQRLSIRMYILYDSYGSPKVRRALPTVRGTNTANTIGTQARPPHPPSLLRLGNLRRCGAIPPIRAHVCGVVDDTCVPGSSLRVRAPPLDSFVAHSHERTVHRQTALTQTPV